VRLTGRPLLLCAAAVTVLAAVLLVRLWPRGGRLRPLARTAGVLLLEALLVFTVGLEVNRREDFYPSWAALAGDTGTGTVVDRVRAGRLDRSILPGRADVVAWQPPGLAAWRFAGPPRLVLPADYGSLPGDRFPVVLDLVPAPAAAAAEQPTPGAVTVVAVPTRATTAAALLSLPTELCHDLRVTRSGWAVEGSGPQGTLAAAFAKDAPAGLATPGRTADTLPPVLAAPMRLVS
jgi:lysyl-tRNA synthetase class 2